MKIIFFDLETFPIIGAVWREWQTDVLWKEEDISLACFAWKELGKKEITCPSVRDCAKGRKNPRYDKELVEELWHVLDSADVVVAHNANKFDVKVANALFIKHGFLPPSPYEVVDTLQQVKAVAKFSSNRLDSLGRELGLGQKVEHAGKHMWRRCLENDIPSWKRMIRYCKQDVNLLEKVYIELLPWMKRHPNVALYKQGDCCPRCGGEHVHRKSRRAYKQVYVYQRYRCNDCGAWLCGERVWKDFKPNLK